MADNSGMMPSPFEMLYRAGAGSGRSRMAYAQGGNGFAILGHAIYQRRENSFAQDTIQKVQQEMANGTPASQAFIKVLQADPSIFAHPQAIEMLGAYQKMLQGPAPIKMGKGEQLLDPSTYKVLAENLDDPDIQAAKFAYPDDPDKQRNMVLHMKMDKAPPQRTIEVGSQKVAQQWMPDPANPGQGRWVDQGHAPLWAPTDLQRNAAAAFPGDPARQQAAIKDSMDKRPIITRLMDQRDALNAAGRGADAEKVQEQINSYAKLNPLAQFFQPQGSDNGGTAIPPIVPGANPQNPGGAKSPVQPAPVPSQQQSSVLPVPPGGEARAPGGIANQYMGSSGATTPLTPAQRAALPQPPSGAVGSPNNPAMSPSMSTSDQSGMAIDPGSLAALAPMFQQHRDVFEGPATQAMKTGQPVPFTDETGKAQTMTPQFGAMILQMYQQQTQGEENQ